MADGRQKDRHEDRATPPARPGSSVTAEAERAGSRVATAARAGRDAEVSSASALMAGPAEGASADPGRDRDPASSGRSAAKQPRTRTAHLRVVHVDPWSVMKTSFVLSIAIGITAIVAVTIVWGVLSAAGVWDSVNSMVRQVADSPSDPTPFDITDYIGTSRVIGFTMIAAVIDVVLITAIATLGAFIYNLAATLVGGVEMTLAEDR